MCSLCLWFMGSGSSFRFLSLKINIRVSLTHAYRLLLSCCSIAKLSRCLRVCAAATSLLSSFGVQHFNEQVVAGHVAVQVFVVKVLFGLQADGSDLRQPEEQLAELVRLLRVVAHDVVQERRVDLFLDTFHQVKVLQVFHIYRRKKQKRWIFQEQKNCETQLCLNNIYLNEQLHASFTPLIGLFFYESGTMFFLILYEFLKKGVFSIYVALIILLFSVCGTMKASRYMLLKKSSNHVAKYFLPPSESSPETTSAEGIWQRQNKGSPERLVPQESMNNVGQRSRPTSSRAAPEPQRFHPSLLYNHKS